MDIREIFDNVIEGENVTKFKEELCDNLKKLDNEEFIRLFCALNLANHSVDDCCGCCCDCCDCEDCDCEDCNY